MWGAAAVLAAVLAGSSPPFRGRKRAAVDVDVGPERRNPRYHETCLESVKESSAAVSKPRCVWLRVPIFNDVSSCMRRLSLNVLHKNNKKINIKCSNASFQFQDEGTQRQALSEGLVACGRQRDTATKVQGEIAYDFVQAKSFRYVAVCLIELLCIAPALYRVSLVLLS